MLGLHDANNLGSIVLYIPESSSVFFFSPCSLQNPHRTFSTVEQGSPSDWHINYKTDNQDQRWLYIQTTVKVVIITAPKCKLEFRMITLDDNISTHLSSVSIIHLSSIFLTGKKGLSSLFFFLLKCQGHSQPNKPVAWDLQMFGLITLPLVVN